MICELFAYKFLSKRGIRPTPKDQPDSLYVQGTRLRAYTVDAILSLRRLSEWVLSILHPRLVLSLGDWGSLEILALTPVRSFVLWPVA